MISTILASNDFDRIGIARQFIATPCGTAPPLLGYSPWCLVEQSQVHNLDWVSVLIEETFMKAAKTTSQQSSNGSNPEPEVAGADRDKAKKTSQPSSNTELQQSYDNELAVAGADRDKNTKPQAIDAVSLIKNDHRKVESLFEQFENAGSDNEKEALADQVCTELIVDIMIEEELFYPACREADVEHEILDEAQVEHDSAKILIADVMRQSAGDEFFDAKVKILSKHVRHQFAEEEVPENGILAKAQQAGIDMMKLGQRLQARKTHLLQLAENGELDLPVLRSLTLHQRQTPKEDRRINRYSNMPDRDEQGRFVSDDDDDRCGRYARSERDDDRRYDRPRDERGRFENDERQSRRRDDDDDDRRSRGRREDDERRYSRGGRGGWYGEAARPGWDERETHRSRGRSDDDYDDRRGSGRDEGQGWYGDPRGHAEAARRGWDERRRSEYDDDRRLRSGDDDDGRGGWYGDPTRPCRGGAARMAKSGTLTSQNPVGMTWL
jgi:hypothetical protein